MSMQLSQCSQGQTVRVERVGGQGAIKMRLVEMGITRGATVRIVKYAPLMDPLEIEIGATHISLRVQEAQLVETTVIA